MGPKLLTFCVIHCGCQPLTSDILSRNESLFNLRSWQRTQSQIEMQAQARGCPRHVFNLHLDHHHHNEKVQVPRDPIHQTPSVQPIRSTSEDPCCSEWRPTLAPVTIICLELFEKLTEAWVGKSPNPRALHPTSLALAVYRKPNDNPSWKARS